MSEDTRNLVPQALFDFVSGNTPGWAVNALRENRITWAEAAADGNGIQAPPEWGSILNIAFRHDRDGVIWGTRGDDTLTGTDDEEYLYGSRGNDTLGAGKGNDKLDGGKGDDVLNGGDGDDHFVNSSGLDRYDGGAGTDTFDFSNVKRSAWTVDLTQGKASDGTTIESLISVENVIGGRKSDTILGTDEANVLKGNSGDDVLAGRGGNDQLIGDKGNDHLDGGTGDDRLEGGSGNDVLVGGAGADVLSGGSGTDTASYKNTAGVQVALDGSLTATADAAGDTFISVEVLEGSLIGADVLRGGSGSETIEGFGGDDVIGGGTGNDTLRGGDGNDVLSGGAGRDRIEGGAGIDTVDYSSEAAETRVYDLRLGKVSLHDSSTFGRDARIISWLNDFLEENDRWADRISNRFEDWFDGGGFFSRFTRSWQGDKLSAIENVVGGAGAEIFYGDDNANRFTGNGGDDTFTGGGGGDVFAFKAGFGKDVIKDFSSGQGAGDIVEFDSAVFANFTQVKAASQQVGSDVVIKVSDANTVTLKNVTLATLHEDDFRFTSGTGGPAPATIQGDSGANRLTGTAANEKFVGGGGNDSFVFAPGFGKDVIDDFTAGAGAGDVIELDDAIFGSHTQVLAASQQVGSDVLITVDAANAILLKNVSLAALHQDDFRFV